MSTIASRRVLLMSTLRSSSLWSTSTSTSTMTRSLGTVADALVPVTVIDGRGDRHPLLARHGRSLASCLVENEMQDSLCTFVSHAHGYDAHIRLTQRWIDTLPPLTPLQQAQVDELVENKEASLVIALFSSLSRSRLASHIQVEHGLKGLTFAVGEMRNCNIL